MMYGANLPPLTVWTMVCITLQAITDPEFAELMLIHNVTQNKANKID